MAQVGGDFYSPIPPWDEPADKLPFHRQEGAGRFWAWLLRKRDPAPTLIVIAAGGGADRRGLSLGYAVADVLRLPRLTHLYAPADPEARHEGAPAPNRHVYEEAKAGRAMVIA